MRALITTMLVIFLLSYGGIAMCETRITAEEMIAESGEAFEDIDMDMLDYYLQQNNMTKERIQKLAKPVISQMIRISQIKPKNNINYLFNRSTNPKDAPDNIRVIAVYLMSETLGKTAYYNVEDHNVYYDPSFFTISCLTNSSVQLQNAAAIIEWAQNEASSIDWAQMSTKYENDNMIGGYGMGIAIEADNGIYSCSIIGTETGAPDSIIAVIMSLLKPPIE